MRLALDTRLHVLEQIADDEENTPTERMKALDMLGRYGMGTTVTETDTDGKDVQRSVLVVPGSVSSATWSTAAQAQQVELEAAKRSIAESHGVG